MDGSCLLHALCAADLSFDLLTSPSSSFDGATLEVTVCSYVFDHLSDPVCTVKLSEFAVRKAISKITGHTLVNFIT